MSNISNQLKVFNDLFMIYGSGLSTKIHSNHAIKIIISTEPFSVLQGHKIIRAKGVIIKSNALHEIKSDSLSSVSIFIDPETDIGKQINRLFGKATVLKLKNETLSEFLDFLNYSLENHFTEAELKNLLVKALINEDITTIPGLVIDERIEEVLKHIKCSSNYDVKFIDLLSLCSLSESRLIHLFKKEIGITIRKYILWCRINLAIKAMATNKTLKMSAEQAGFTDAAHFNRTFVSMFGINPSILLSK